MILATGKTISTKIFFRWLPKAVLVVAGLAILLVLVVLAINIRDEPLGADAKSILSYTLEPVSPVKNGFFFFAGMDVDETGDPLSSGKDMFARFEGSYHGERSPDSTPVMLSNKKLRVTWKYIDCHEECTRRLVDHRPEYVALLAANKLLLDRYITFGGFGVYQEPLMRSVDQPIPQYHLLYMGSDMLNVKAVYEIADGQVNDGINDLASNMSTARMLLRQTSSLLGKMVAVAMIKREVTLIVDLAKSYPALNARYGDALSAILSPLSKDEMSFNRVFANEAQLSVSVFMRLRDDDKPCCSIDRLSMMLYQPNQTANLIAQLWRPILAWGDLPPSSFDFLEISSMASENSRNLDSPWMHLSFAYNPVGKTFYAMGVSQRDYLGYLEKCADTDGYIRLAALFFNIKKRPASDGEMQAYIDSTGQYFRDPYRNMPMHWNSKDRQIEFVGRQFVGNSHSKTYAIKM